MAPRPAGSRISSYISTGTSYTFKALGDWRVNDWLRLRGGFNRAERAPNLAELAITPTTNPGYPSSNIVNVNGGYQFNDAVRLRFGIDKLFFKRPRLINVNQNADPATGSSLSYFDDVQGRRFSVGANIRF